MRKMYPFLGKWINTQIEMNYQLPLIIIRFCQILSGSMSKHYQYSLYWLRKYSWNNTTLWLNIPHLCFGLYDEISLRAHNKICFISTYLISFIVAPDEKKTTKQNFLTVPKNGAHAFPRNMVWLSFCFFYKSDLLPLHELSFWFWHNVRDSCRVTSDYVTYIKSSSSFLYHMREMIILQSCTFLFST